MKELTILDKYSDYCKSKGIEFTEITKVNPYDSTTLFCPAGMQKYKQQFVDETVKGTVANSQACIRLNDLEEISDSTHLLYFDMLGLFSFREMTIKQAIEFWLGFMEILQIKLGYVTIHPDKFDEWSGYYPSSLEIRKDDSCTWTDGSIGGYCTEFFVNDIEIGNIVNPLGNCIDVGFGLQRLEMIINPEKVETTEEKLISACNRIIESGYSPSNIKQGYVLRKLLRIIHKSGYTLDHRFFEEEITRQSVIRARYERLKNKHTDKSKEWWFDTHGINLDEL